MKIKTIVGISFAACTLASTIAYIYVVKKIADNIDDITNSADISEEFFDDEDESTEVIE